MGSPQNPRVEVPVSPPLCGRRSAHGTSTSPMSQSPSNSIHSSGSHSPVNAVPLVEGQNVIYTHSSPERHPSTAESASPENSDLLGSRAQRRADYSYDSGHAGDLDSVSESLSEVAITPSNPASRGRRSRINRYESLLQEPVANQTYFNLVAAHCSESMQDLASPANSNVSEVLVLYTGGTIGMTHTSMGYAPQPGYLLSQLSKLPMFHDSSFEGEGLMSPSTKYGKRVHYVIKEYSPLLDSSCMLTKDMLRVAHDIKVNYDKYDAFVVLHGTDTMAYTASLLAFVLENLGKTVVVTGSQIPISEVMNDAVDNLLGALIIAGHYVIPEVTLYFNRRLFRGCRATKVNVVQFEAFDSPNLRPLARVGVDINVAWDTVRRPDPGRFIVRNSIERHVEIFRITPYVSTQTLVTFLATPNLKGVVLQTYGAGNAPINRLGIMNALRDATARGVVVVNCTQCEKGPTLSHLYETGTVLEEAGVTPGIDMTAEAALAKLSYLLGLGLAVEEVRRLIPVDMRGELTVVEKKARFTWEDPQLALVRRSIGGEGERGSGETPERHPDVAGVLRPTLLPVMLCSAAASGRTEVLAELLDVQVGQGETAINTPDYDGRTALHLAVCEGHRSTVELLVSYGCSVHIRDRYGANPLFEAVVRNRTSIAAYLKRNGAALPPLNDWPSGGAEVYLVSAALHGDLEALDRWRRYGAAIDVYRSPTDGSSLLHIAACHGQVRIIKMLCDQYAEILLPATDIYGRTALDIAIARKHSDATLLLKEAMDRCVNDELEM